MMHRMNKVISAAEWDGASGRDQGRVPGSRGWKELGFEGQRCKGQGPAAFRGERGPRRVGLTRENPTKPIVSNKDVPDLDVDRSLPQVAEHTSHIQSPLWFVSCVPVRVPVHHKRVWIFFCRIAFGSEFNFSAQVGCFSSNPFAVSGNNWCNYLLSHKGKTPIWSLISFFFIHFGWGGSLKVEKRSVRDFLFDDTSI